jgi:hypothetical protein
MPKVSYAPNVKAKFIAAASAARSAGKPWAVAFSAAREAGYNGSLPGIMQMLRGLKAKSGKAGRKLGRKPGRKPGRKAIVKAVPIAAKRGPGRPPKVNAETGGIEALVSKVVSERVGAILEKAIAALEELR